jgi:hypothetical protein
MELGQRNSYTIFTKDKPMQNLLKTFIVLFLTVSTCDFIATPLLADTGQVIVYRRLFFRRQRVKPKLQPVAPIQETKPNIAKPQQQNETLPNLPEDKPKVKPAENNNIIAFQYVTSVDNIPKPIDETAALQDFSEEGRGVKNFFGEEIQQAVIAWNGKEEILVLSTKQQHNVKQDMAALSFLPLPGEPKDITAGDPKLYDRFFKKIIDLADAQEPNWRNNPKWKDSEGRGGAMEVLFNRDIGSHHIAAIKVKDKNIDSFYESLQEYLNDNFGEGMAVLLGEKEKTVFEYYIKKKGFEYFAVDIQELKADGKAKQKEAIAYHFESPYLFYSLVISQLGGSHSDTQVQIAAITPYAELNFLGYKRDKMNHTPTILIRPSDLQEVDQDIAKFMSQTEKNKIFTARIWIIDGKLDSFSQDFIVESKK